MCDRDWINKYIAAGRLDTSVMQLRKLAQDIDSKIRARVGENPSTPVELLMSLSKDHCSDVRIAVASNTTCPITIIENLLKDQDPTVRFYLAEDPNLPERILVSLVEDENSYVSHRAIRTLKNLRDSKSQKDNVVQFAPLSFSQYA